MRDTEKYTNPLLEICSNLFILNLIIIKKILILYLYKFQATFFYRTHVNIINELQIIGSFLMLKYSYVNLFVFQEENLLSHLINVIWYEIFFSSFLCEFCCIFSWNQKNLPHLSQISPSLIKKCAKLHETQSFSISQKPTFKINFQISGGAQIWMRKMCFKTFHSILFFSDDQSADFFKVLKYLSNLKNLLTSGKEKIEVRNYFSEPLQR